MSALLAGLSSFEPGRPAGKRVFHYTTAEGLLGIVTSGTLRASEASSLNDLAEVRQGWESIRRMVNELPAGDSRDLLQSHAERPLLERHEVFVLSASIADDDANQWRLYGGGGRGYVIELDGTVQLSAVSNVEAPPRRPPQPGFVDWSHLIDSTLVTPWLHVLYSDDDVDGVLRHLIDCIDDERSYLDTIEDEQDHDAERDRIRDESYGLLAQVAHLIKSPGFVGENEVRIVATFPFGQDHVSYRSSLLGVVGYVTLTEAAPGRERKRLLRPVGGVPVATQLPLKSVRTGPLLPEEHRNSLRGFLKQNAVPREVTIHTSRVPLR